MIRVTGDNRNFEYREDKATIQILNSTWSYENRVSKHFVISLNFPCLIVSLLSYLLMCYFCSFCGYGFV